MCIRDRFALVRCSISSLQDENSDSDFSRSALWLLSRLDFAFCAVIFGRILSFTAAVYFGFCVASFATTSSYKLVGIVLLMLIYLVCGELATKSLAIRFPKKIMLIIAQPISLLTTVSLPVVVISRVLTNIALKPFSTSIPAKVDRVRSLNELSHLVSQHEERGVLDESEGEIIREVIGFSETLAKEVMTPRTDFVLSLIHI